MTTENAMDWSATATEVDPRYEFCAPRYHDFSRKSSAHEALEAEAWFEGFETAGMKSPISQSARSNTMEEASTNPEGEEEITSEPTTEPSQAHTDAAVTEQHPVQTIDSGEVDTTGEVDITGEVDHVIAATPAAKDMEVETPVSVHPSEVEEPTTLTRKKRSIQSISRSPPRTTPVQLTVPQSPKLGTTTRTRSKKPPQSTEERQLARGRAEANLEAKRRKVQQNTLNKVLHSTVPLGGGVKCQKPLTTPRGPKLHTTVRKHDMKTRSMGDTGEEAKEPYVPLAERLAKFERQDRCTTRGPADKGLLKKSKSELTVPSSPKLHVSTSRARQNKDAPKTAAEKEEEELQDMKKNQFKARPLNRQVLLSNGDLGVPRVTPRARTVTAEFQLNTDVRGKDTKAKAELQKQKEEEQLRKRQKFQARPLNKKVLESCGDLGVPRVVPKGPTQSKEFKLRSSARAVEHAVSTSYSPAPEEAKRPKTAPQRTATGATKVEEFSLRTEARGAQKWDVLMENLVEEEYQALCAKDFVARGYPLTTDYYNPPQLPAPKVTETQEFNLRSKALHDDAVAEQTNQIQAQAREDRENRQFTAHGVPSTHQKPMVVNPPRRYLETIRNHTLNSDTRALARKGFDREMKEKEAAAKVQRARLDAEERKEEEEEIKKMRKKMGHKARAMPDFSKPFVPSLKSTTCTRKAAPGVSTRSRGITTMR